MARHDFWGRENVGKKRDGVRGATSQMRGKSSKESTEMRQTSLGAAYQLIEMGQFKLQDITTNKSMLLAEHL